MEFSKIYEGWRNTLFPPNEIKEFIDRVSTERLAECKKCPFNSTPNKTKIYSYCRDCGCPLIQKSKSLSSECPQKHWLAIASQEQQDEIRKYNNEKDPTDNTDMPSVS